MALSDFNHENIRMMESINLYGFFFFLVFSPFSLPCSSGRMVLESSCDDFFPVIQVGGHQKQMDSKLNYPLNNVKILNNMNSDLVTFF